jgi:23S rRNA (guanine2445-N2)-methyltransferase / 23S rRNA (guanine2069-N7)-methyltransferase
LNPSQTYTFFNGAIECRLFNFKPTGEQSDVGKSPRVTKNRAFPKDWTAGEEVLSFKNRLKKNLKRLKKWRESEGIRCFRVYDSDLPEYAVAVEVYHDNVHVQEYQAPVTVDPEKARSRLNDILSVLPDVLNVPDENIFLKVRQHQKGKSQYQQLKSEQVFYEVLEGKCRFLVNFDDYLDTGLFLDHRSTRQMIGKLAHGKRFLNLFAYTGTVTVHAAMGGALSTTSVDSSQTYLDWARRNMDLNQIKLDQHHFEKSDCITWLKRTSRRYDLIFLDPPTFSNSRNSKSVFDVQKDHPHLIQLASSCLTEAGTLIFSNNLRNFKLEKQIRDTYHVEEISRETLPPDFQRRPNIHHCWTISLRDRS